MTASTSVIGWLKQCTSFGQKNVPPADPTPAGTAPSGLSTSDAQGIFRPGWLR